MKSLMVLAVIVSITAAGNCLFGAPPEERISILERQVTDIQRTYLSNSQETASAVSRISAFHDDFGALKGQIEALSHQIQTQHEEFLRRTNELENRTAAIEDKMSIFTSGVMSALEKVSPAAAEETALYQKSLELAESSKYLESAAAFQSFADKYPKSKFASSAKFWIAECFYSLRDYKRAIKEYQNFIEKYPKDPKVSEAIFKQGNSFYELGLLDESRSFYEKVIAAYPQSPAAKNAKVKHARINERQARPQTQAGQAGGVSAKPAGSDFSSYPAETIEQQRQKMGAPEGGQKDPAKTTKEF